jgi:hypothetical protein
MHQANMFTLKFVFTLDQMANTIYVYFKIYVYT